MHRILGAEAEDRWFVVEMARFACTLKNRPLPGPDTPEVLACLPRAMSAAVIAVSDNGTPLGAAWWHLHSPALLVGPDGSELPELTMAVAEDARGAGIGTTLIEALANNAATRFTELAFETSTSATRPPDCTRAAAFTSPARAEDRSASR